MEQPFIFWLASWYPTKLDPFPGDFIQRHAKALALYHPVHVLHIAKDEKGTITKDVFIEENADGNLHETIIYYHPLKTGFSLIDKVLSRSNFLKLGKKFIKQKIAVNPLLFIHVHVAMRHGLLAYWAKRKFNINYVITEHWTGYDQKKYPDHWRPKWFWKATKKIFQQATYFYPEVNRVGELVNKTITPIPYKPVSNCVDVSLFYPEKTKADPKQTFQFIHVSTLSHQKNIQGILRVIERWATHNSHAHFTFIGPASKEIVEQVNSSATLSKAITVTGSMSYDSVAQYMRQAHALLMFSRYENQPCVIVEALCCGLPVLSTNVGGINEVINSTNGILIENENEDALYDAIDSMINNYDRFDVASMASMAKEMYSYEIIGRQILEYYHLDLPGYF